MSKHTPGPWEVVVDIRHQGEEEEYVAGFDIIGPEGVSVVGCEGISGGSAMERANARLVAAAPDLLEALEVMVGKARKQNWNDNYPVELQKAVDAIAKAKGEKS